MGWLLVMMLCVGSNCQETPVDRFDNQLECVAAKHRADTRLEEGQSFFCLAEGEKRI